MEGLHVEETPGGFQFSAPPNSECGNWLSYWAENEKRKKVFSREIMKAIMTQIEETIKS
jgi:hypothetical protein